MSYEPSAVTREGFVSEFVSPFTKEGPYSEYVGAAPASTAWPTANKAMYFPIIVPVACVARRLFWCNGATVGTNNLQAGIYREDFSALVLGTSTLSAGASACQFDNITDTSLSPGRYFLALWCNGTTATVLRGGATVAFRPAGYWEETSLTGGLPSTMTPVAVSSTTSGYVPVFGFTTRATP